MSVSNAQMIVTASQQYSESGYLKESESPAICFHCQQQIPAYVNIHAVIDGVPRAMCCTGCKSAAEFITQNGCVDFYQQRDLIGVTNRLKMPELAVEPFNVEEWNIVASSSRLNVTVVAPELYCSSCSRLLHTSLSKLPYQVEISVNVSNKQIQISWSGNDSDLASILATIKQLGYSVTPISSREKSARDFHRKQNDAYLKRILVAGLGTMQVMTYAVAHYLGAMETSELARFLELASMLVATFVVLYSGQPFFSNAWRDIRNHHLGMDVPVALAIGSAFLLSAVQTLFAIEGRSLYYDSAVMFVFFLLLGRYVEFKVRHRFIDTEDAINRSLPSKLLVNRRQQQAVHRIEVRPRDIQVNDEILLKAGNIVPCDAIVIGQAVEVDESIVTGELHSVCRSNQDRLLSGTRLVSGETIARCTHAWEDSSLAAIERMVAQNKHGVSLQTGLVDVLNRYFIIEVLGLTMVVAMAWSLYQPDRVFEVVLAMLIATCPCAFALAAPVGIAVASNTLRRFGIILVNANSLDKLNSARQWWFDKTGTVTEGMPQLTAIDAFTDAGTDHCLDLLNVLEAQSLHPISRAFKGREKRFNMTDYTEAVGCGVQGNINGEHYYAGKLSWILQKIVNAEPIPDETLVNNGLSNESGSLVFLANSKEILAKVQLQDHARAHLQDVLHELNECGISTTLVSGDTDHSVKNFVQNYSFSYSYSQQTPQQKMALLRAMSKRSGAIVMVGDGANDAPILSIADVSIALQSGSELSRAQADILLLNSDLTSLLILKRVARRTTSIKRQNLIWAIAYNAAILPLAATGLLTPWIAAVGMSMSSLGVVLNAVRIRAVNTAITGVS